MSWTLENWDRLLAALGEHVALVAIALAISLAIGLPLGIVSARRARLYAAVVAVAGILYTIPALALFALLLPLMGLGTAPAVTALVLYSLMVLVRNTATGLREVPPEIVEAADGMGFDRRRRLLRVELPLALPVIVAGIRITTVTQISVATVAAYISAGGLGDIIFQGITQDFNEKIVAGALATSLLAILADEGLRWAERDPRPQRDARVSALVEWLAGHPRVFLDAARQHLALSATALVAGLAIALPLAFALVRRPRVAALTIGIVNVLRTIPSLAVLVVLLPLLGTGFLPSVVALTIYALPAILINAHTGLTGIDPDLIDAARGQGMTNGQVTARVRIPLALPVTFAGIRTGAVQIVSAATLAAFIGGGGFGDLITAGMGTLDVPQLVAGALAVALLALAIELGLGRVEAGLARRAGAPA